MGSGGYRPQGCTRCGKVACKGDCAKCPKRLAGECKELYFPVPVEQDGGTYYEAWCKECYEKRGES